MNEKDYLEKLEKYIHDVNECNKNIVRWASILVITCFLSCFAFLGFCAYTYFTADYYYPTIETNNSQNTNNTIGGIN